MTRLEPVKPAVVIVFPYGIEYGPTRIFENVVRGVAQAGFKPVCVFRSSATQTIGLEQEIHLASELETVPRTLNPIRLARFLRAHVRTAKRIQAIAVDADAAVIYSMSEAIFCGSLAARRLGIASVVHVMGMSIQSPRWAAKIYIPFLNKLTDEFISISSAVAEMLAKYRVPDDHIAVIHNGASISDIDRSANLPSPTEHSGPRIGMVAAFDVRKGHELFVEAAALIAEQHPDARFYLIGGRLAGQPESEAFEQRIVTLIHRLGLQEKFEQPGYAARPDVYRWIRAMDIVIVPSETEAGGPSFAMLEAMICERAVVATAIEGNLDAFIDRHSGRYVDRTPELVAAVTCELIEDPAQRERLGTSARARAKLLFDIDTLPALGEAVSELLQLKQQALRRD